MATPFTHFLVAVVSLAAVYCGMATSWNAWADDLSDEAPIPAELLQWHSGLSGAGDSCVILEGKSAHAARQPGDSAAYLVMHGAVGLRDAGLDGSDFWFNYSDAPEGARKPARNPGAAPGAFQGISD